MDELAIVILNYNGIWFLETFLPTLLAHADGHAVYVADNASTDGSVAFLQKNFPQVKLVLLAGNYGYAEGYNRALAQVQARYYCLLNSDVEVTPGWLAPLLGYLNAHPQVAAIQPKILDYHLRGAFEHGGGMGGFIDTLGYPCTRGRMFDFCEEDRGQYDRIARCFWAAGACFLIRAEVFRETGGFDGDFFAHMEEIDLCWRLQLAGYSVVAHPQATVYHVGGGTLAYRNPRKIYLNFRNGLMMLYKNLPAAQLPWKLLLRLLLDGLAALQMLVTGYPAGVWIVLRAHFGFYRRLPSLQQKRQALARLRHRALPATTYPGSVVVAYFLKSKKTFASLGWEPADLHPAEKASL